jgi:hypothetical protein
MAEWPESHFQAGSESPSSLGPILNLLLSVGYAEVRKPDISASNKLSGGLAWCIAAVNDVVLDGILIRLEEMHVTLPDLIAINNLNNQIQNSICSLIVNVVVLRSAVRLKSALKKV